MENLSITVPAVCLTLTMLLETAFVVFLITLVCVSCGDKQKERI